MIFKYILFEAMCNVYIIVYNLYAQQNKQLQSRLGLTNNYFILLFKYKF